MIGRYIKALRANSSDSQLTYKFAHDLWKSALIKEADPFLSEIG